MTKPMPKPMTKPSPKPIAAPSNAARRMKASAVMKAIAVLQGAGLPEPAALKIKSMLLGVRWRRSPPKRLIPNAETIEAMRAARRGELVTVGSVDALFADLNADD